MRHISYSWMVIQFGIDPIILDSRKSMNQRRFWKRKARIVDKIHEDSVRGFGERM